MEFIQHIDPAVTFEKEIKSEKFSETKITAVFSLDIQAHQTHDIIGKNLHEFKRSGKNCVPDIFILLVAYFEINEDLLKLEGLFRKNGAIDRVEELQMHIAMGNYYFLTQLSKEPHVVANFMKKILNNMAEPLCPF